MEIHVWTVDLVTARWARPLIYPTLLILLFFPETLERNLQRKCLKESSSAENSSSVNEVLLSLNLQIHKDGALIKVVYFSSNRKWMDGGTLFERGCFWSNTNSQTVDTSMNSWTSHINSNHGRRLTVWFQSDSDALNRLRRIVVIDPGSWSLFLFLISAEGGPDQTWVLLLVSDKLAKWMNFLHWRWNVLIWFYLMWWNFCYKHVRTNKVLITNHNIQSASVFLLF